MNYAIFSVTISSKLQKPQRSTSKGGKLSLVALLAPGTLGNHLFSHGKQVSYSIRTYGQPWCRTLWIPLGISHRYWKNPSIDVFFVKTLQVSITVYYNHEIHGWPSLDNLIKKAKNHWHHRAGFILVTVPLSWRKVKSPSLPHSHCPSTSGFSSHL